MRLGKSNRTLNIRLSPTWAFSKSRYYTCTIYCIGWLLISIDAKRPQVSLANMAHLLRNVEEAINHTCELTAFFEKERLHLRIVFTPSTGHRVPNFYQDSFSWKQMYDTNEVGQERLIRRFIDGANGFIRRSYPQGEKHAPQHYC